MAEHLMEIFYELQLMREELRSRLFEHCAFHSPMDPRKASLIHSVKEELYDVENALQKMEAGQFGMCEETGRSIPVEKLRVIPTARTIKDFSYQEAYERKSLPFYEYNVIAFSEDEPQKEHIYSM
ncbi:TraR/DksA family transcriptional regulator [Bacillus lacus]|uniref:TraR/DksA family transcriptional regulator n=1 Tax=Metabacillus lacus TaxID=1983721 RepID=A0A7X2LZE3_9BACI|nr:TraR/DksA family transcriptional regulator [Metabacillus lacus]MRX73326.1 TraR/DksA family transcriptional regulator [Metabacillus lacus]